MNASKIGTANGRKITGWAATATILPAVIVDGKTTKTERVKIVPMVNAKTKKPGANLYFVKKPGELPAWQVSEKTGSGLSVLLTEAESAALLADVKTRYASEKTDVKTGKTVKTDGTFADFVAKITDGTGFALVLPAAPADPSSRKTWTRGTVTDEDRTAALAALAALDEEDAPAAPAA